MKRGLCFLITCAIITTNLPTTFASSYKDSSIIDMDALYEVSDITDYSFEELNDNPQLLDQFLDEKLEDAEVVSTTSTPEIDEIWDQLTALNLRISQLQEARMAAKELKQRLLKIQSVRKESATRLEEYDDQDEALMILSELEPEEIESILSELNSFDEAKTERALDEYYNEYAALEAELEALGATPTEQELQETLLSDQELQRSIGLAQDDLTDQNSYATTALPPPDLSAVANLYTMVKSYCTVSVSGKQYTTYTIKVQDKPNGNRMYTSYSPFTMYCINQVNPNAVNEFLGTMFEGIVVEGVGKFTAAYLQSEAAGKGAKWFVKAVLALIHKADTEITLLTTNKDTYRITINHTAQMKYVWVQDSGGSWWLANSANKAEICEDHHFSFQYYDCIRGENRPFQESVIVSTFLNGRFYSAEVDAANWYHSYTLYGADPLWMEPLRSTVGSLEYVGKQNGKEAKTKITPFYAYYPMQLL